jgi:hypothetical protein
MAVDSRFGKFHCKTVGNSMPMRPMRGLGNQKYNNQQRLGLGDKGSKGRQLVGAANGTAAAAAAV